MAAAAFPSGDPRSSLQAFFDVPRPRFDTGQLVRTAAGASGKVIGFYLREPVTVLVALDSGESEYPPEDLFAA